MVLLKESVTFFFNGGEEYGHWREREREGQPGSKLKPSLIGQVTLGICIIFPIFSFPLCEMGIIICIFQGAYEVR